MFRRSSPRALISTRHTLSFPSSAASISAGTSGDSSLVRYTVALMAITSGSIAEPAHERLERPLERLVRLLDEEVGARDLREHVAGVRGGREAGRGTIGTQGSSFSSGRSRAAIWLDSRTGRAARDRVDLVVADAEAGLEAFDHRLRGRRGDLEADGVAEAAAAQLELDRLEQVVGLVGDLEVGVTGDAEDSALGDLHLREEPGKEVRDHALEGYEQAALSHLDEARHPLRDLHAREALFARLGVDTKTAG